MKSIDELREMSDIELSEQLSQLRLTLNNIYASVKDTKKAIGWILALQNERRLQKDVKT